MQVCLFAILSWLFDHHCMFCSLPQNKRNFLAQTIMPISAHCQNLKGKRTILGAKPSKGQFWAPNPQKDNFGCQTLKRTILGTLMTLCIPSIISLDVKLLMWGCWGCVCVCLWQVVRCVLIYLGHVSLKRCGCHVRFAATCCNAHLDVRRPQLIDLPHVSPVVYRQPQFGFLTWHVYKCSSCCWILHCISCCLLFVGSSNLILADSLLIWWLHADSSHPSFLNCCHWYWVCAGVSSVCCLLPLLTSSQVKQARQYIEMWTLSCNIFQCVWHEMVPCLRALLWFPQSSCVTYFQCMWHEWFHSIPCMFINLLGM